MSDPYVGEIRLFAFSRAPNGWLACSGQSLPITNYLNLFEVIGTTYGGNGQSNFNLPDLRGRVPIHLGQGSHLPLYTIGQVAGEEEHSLTDAEMPPHSHALVSSTATGTATTPANNLHLATISEGTLYAQATNAAPYQTMAPCVATAGQSAPHENMMPTVVGNYCIAFVGIFPSPG